MQPWPVASCVAVATGACCPSSSALDTYLDWAFQYGSPPWFEYVKLSSEAVCLAYCTEAAGNQATFCTTVAQCFPGVMEKLGEEHTAQVHRRATDTTTALMDDDYGWDQGVPPDSRRWMWGCVASPGADVSDPVTYCMNQKGVPANVTKSHLQAVITSRDAVVDFQHVCDVRRDERFHCSGYPVLATARVFLSAGTGMKWLMIAQTGLAGWLA